MIRHPAETLTSQIDRALRNTPACWITTGPTEPHSASSGHRYDSHCALCQRDVPSLTAALLDVMRHHPATQVLTRIRAWAATTKHGAAAAEILELLDGRRDG